jgi:hypothetical protein
VLRFGCSFLVIILAFVTQISASYAGHTTEVWVGAPASGSWPASCSGKKYYPSNTCSLPPFHWDLNSGSGTKDDGDWSADLIIPGGNQVYLYVAPQVTANVITAKVESVGQACASGNGGMVVRIGVYNGTAKIGQILYAHLTQGTTPAVGTIARWGGYLGTVASGLPSDATCWTAPHVHFELYNVENYACYLNRSPGSVFSSTNFMGFMGGSRVVGPRMPCP